jgi:hypothetical protein
MREENGGERGGARRDSPACCGERFGRWPVARTAASDGYELGNPSGAAADGRELVFVCDVVRG